MQTAVSNRMPIGVPGQLADLHTAEFGQVDSATSEEASAEIPFGVFVKGGTEDDSCKLLAATTDKLLGVTVFAHNFAKPVQLGDTGIKPGVTVGVLKKGRILVLTEDAVTPASEVHVRAVAAGLEVKGAVRGTADGTDTIDITAFAKFTSSAGAGEVVELEIDMTNSALQAADV